MEPFGRVLGPDHGGHGFFAILSSRGRSGSSALSGTHRERSAAGYCSGAIGRPRASKIWTSFAEFRFYASGTGRLYAIARRYPARFHLYTRRVQQAPNTTGTTRSARYVPIRWVPNTFLSAAADVDAKGFLFFSSAEIYGDLPETMIPTRESDVGVLDPTDPRNCYAESKRLGEALCIAWHRQFGVATSIVRPFHVYGPGMRFDDGRVFADFAAAVVAGPRY